MIGSFDRYAASTRDELLEYFNSGASMDDKRYVFFSSGDLFPSAWFEFDVPDDVKEIVDEYYPGIASGSFLGPCPYIPEDAYDKLISWAMKNGYRGFER